MRFLDGTRHQNVRLASLAADTLIWEYHVTILPKKGRMLIESPPSPRLAAVMVGSGQKGGTPTSPTAQMIFAHLYVTHPPTVAVWSAARDATAACEFYAKLGGC